MSRKCFYFSFCLLLAASLSFSCKSMISRKDLAKEYYNIGNAFYDLGQIDKAVEYYTRAIGLDNSLLKANYNLARAYIEQDQYDQGIAVLDLLLKKDPENTLILKTLGYAYFKKGELETARAYYEKVLQLSELDNSSLYNMGVLCQMEGKDDEALEYFLKLYKVSPSGDVLKKLGDIYSLSDNNEQAILYYEEYLLSNKSDMEAVSALKDLYIKEAYYYKAVEQLDNLVALSSDSSVQAGYYFEKGYIQLISIGDYQKGIESLNKALDNGFRDKTKIAELLNAAKGDLSRTLTELFKKRGIYP